MNYSAATLPLYLYPKRNQEISPFKGLRSVGMNGVSGNGEVGKNEDKSRESGKPGRDADQLEPAQETPGAFPGHDRIFPDLPLRVRLLTLTAV
jgi:hypothetical protein